MIFYVVELTNFDRKMKITKLIICYILISYALTDIVLPKIERYK